jgi:hypothetical protein
MTPPGPAPAPAPAPRPEPISAQLPVDEAVWEAEPELEAIDETPVRRELSGDGNAPPDATRLFAPDLLGRPARLPEPPPEVPDPPVAPRAGRGDFSFGDLDFEEPSGARPNPNQSQIFGDSFGSGSDQPALDAPQSLESVEAEALADPLYSQTRFLDPHAAPPAHFDTPNPAAAPPLPDLLAGEEITQPSDEDDAPELSDADLEPLDSGDPLSEPFSPETQAALSEPEFQPHEAPRAETPREYAATRLMMEHDAEPPARTMLLDAPADLPPAEPLPLPERDTAPSLAPFPAPVPKPALPASPVPSAAAATAVLPPPRAVMAANAAAMIDSAQLAQVVEKVAWEAFGALSEQVVGEVMKRVEAVVWEVVPQLCERLIQEEIARLKAELPE